MLGVCAITGYHLCKVDIEKYGNTRKKRNIFLWLVLVYKVLRTSLPFVCWQDFKKFVVFDCSVRFLFYIFYFTGKKIEVFFLYQFVIGNVKDEEGIGAGGLDSFFPNSLIPIGLALSPAVLQHPRSPCPR